MRVQLIGHTPDPDRTCAIAALQCYSDRGASEIRDTISPDQVREVLDYVVRAGHHSVLEHAVFTFTIEGVSRVTTHQLVRHRIASYAQQSQRYVRQDQPDYIVPPSVTEAGMEGAYRAAIESAWRAYAALIEAGVPQEDARYVLPNAAASKIVVTMNTRALWNFFTLRTCRRAQWEIRETATRMLREVKAVSPILFENSGPACLRGPCPEGAKGCGRPYKAFPPEAEEEGGA